MSLAELIPTAVDGSTLLDAYLREQQSLTAVEKFSRLHEATIEPLQARYYRDLVPLTLPQPGEQFAFEVDLDVCSGCKGCVTACHSLNGLEEEETWRSVGLLQGGSASLPVLQHVTTACHHCVEPGCLSGCPVNAYEKDEITGIVRHLDDQCIGCQYCILKCPYDVPKYSKSKGIVRKCDMCRDRLAVGEAPACVQACPNQAIRITIVNKQQVIEDSEANLFLVGAPEPSYTLPTTIYKSAKPLPRNLLPADYFAARPQHAHWPLIWMLVLTQLSVGGFAIEQILASGWLTIDAALMAAIRPVHIMVALTLGLLGLNASIFHLGRPLYAFRAVLGLRTSWLSREIVGFGLFAGAASAYTAAAWLDSHGYDIGETTQRLLGVATAVMGVAAVMCSVMIYVDTQREFWNFGATTRKFLLTCLLLGVPVAVLSALGGSLVLTSIDPTLVIAQIARPLWQVLFTATAIKLLAEASVFVSLAQTRHTPLRRTATLMAGELARATFARFALGIIGGMVLPLVMMNSPTLAPSTATILASLSLVMLFAGEVLERYLFFAAVVAPKMPGSPAS